MLRILVGVVILGVASAIALILGKRMNANAIATTGDFLRGAAAQFRNLRRAGELEPVWVMISGTVNGALGVSDQRLFFTTVSGLEAIERKDVASLSAVPKNFGGARHQWGHEISIELRDGRRHALVLIDRADYFPPEHDAASVLARLVGGGA